MKKNVIKFLVIYLFFTELCSSQEQHLESKIVELFREAKQGDPEKGLDFWRLYQKLPKESYLRTKVSYKEAIGLVEKLAQDGNGEAHLEICMELWGGLKSKERRKHLWIASGEQPIGAGLLLCCYDAFEQEEPDMAVLLSKYFFNRNNKNVIPDTKEPFSGGGISRMDIKSFEDFLKGELVIADASKTSAKFKSDQIVSVINLWFVLSDQI